MDSYIDRLKGYDCKSVEDLIKMCKSSLNDIYSYKPWTHPELNHGEALLETEEALDCYMAAYGEMHVYKCRTSLSNFPYNEINAALEIVDWGCGQGIGSLCVIDALTAHNLTMLLKRITLIEPSKSALKRAEDNISYLTNKGVEINAINRYLPCSNKDLNVTENIVCRHRIIIHVFSNILDVGDIDLIKTAQLIAGSDKIHIILITGPKNSRSFRINQFASLFAPQNIFSNICSNNYAVTTTGHPFTCITKGFVYNGKSLDYSQFNSIETSEEPVYDDYDLRLHFQNNTISKDKGRVAFRLQNILLPNDVIFSKVEINESYTDFIIIRPNKGIMILNVFEENINDFRFEGDKNQEPETGHETYKINYNTLENKETGEKIQSPLFSISFSQESIKDGIEEILRNTIKNVSNLSVIKKVVVFAQNSIEEVSNFFKCVIETKHFISAQKENRYTSIYGKDFITSASLSYNMYKDIKFDTYYKFFDDFVFHKIIFLLSPKWHSYREGICNIDLTPAQRNLVFSDVPQQKISGVAGSGKTLIMIMRAVYSQRQTGGDVLLLSFNITLSNYIRFRLGQLREDFNWDKFHIYHYHKFFRYQASKLGLHVGYNSYDDEEFYEVSKDKIERYSAIFVDEVQDYNISWLRILKRYFLKKGGEFVLFGDPKQNIYERELDKNGNVKIDVIKAGWNNSLKIGKRFTNPLLADLAVDFQNEFFRELPVDDIQKEHNKPTMLNFNVLTYIDTRNDNSMETLVNQCVEIINNSNVEKQNFAILAFRNTFLREFEYKFRCITKEEVETSFIPKNQFDDIISSFDIKNISDDGKKRLRNTLDSLDVNRKNQFTCSSRNIKISTVQSFKGWESPAVILIMEEGNRLNLHDYISISPEIMYTGITRAREELYIINRNCNKYHEFFSKYKV